MQISMTEDEGAAEHAGPAMPEGGKAVLAVIINCYNYAEFVGRAIASVAEQQDERCELVVIDDGSTDGSWDVIRRSGVSACRLRNRGQRLACLYGVDRTSAPFVLFLDADDELRPGSIATILENLDTGVGKLQFGLSRIDASGRPIEHDHDSDRYFRDRDRLVHTVLRDGVYKTPPTSGNVFRRDVCELLRAADYDNTVDGIILFAAPFFGDVVNLPERLGAYRIHDRNKSGLGRAPTPDLIASDLERFEARMRHLRDVLKRIAPAARLTAVERTFYHLEQSFNLAIASGRRPSFPLFLEAVTALLWHERPLRAKGAMLFFFLTAFMLPNHRAKAILAYRLRVDSRSMKGLLKELFGRRLPGHDMT